MLLSPLSRNFLRLICFRGSDTITDPKFRIVEASARTAFGGAGGARSACPLPRSLRPSVRWRPPPLSHWPLSLPPPGTSFDFTHHRVVIELSSPDTRTESGTDYQEEIRRSAIKGVKRIQTSETEEREAGRPSSYQGSFCDGCGRTLEIT